jgi:serine/threonine protein kinase
VAVQTNGTLLADRYRVLRRLGSGGAATVFLCEDQRLGRKVAVKRMHADSPEDMARRLHREARLGASLNHPGLVSVFDTVTYDEGVLVIMEYVDGETLAEALKRGPLGTRHALDVVRGVAGALDHAHAHGVVHRDVKPANVLLGKDGAVKLVDLGISTAAGHTRITRSGMVLGTPAYMAPEQVEGAAVTPAADIYALGAMAYEMLSGRKARQGTTPIEVAHKAATEPPPDLRNAWPEAPRAAAAAIKKAMAREPGGRQRSAGEFAEELSAAISGPPREEPTQRTQAIRPVGHLLEPVPRRRVPAWLPALLLLVVVGAVAGLIATSGGGGGGGGSSSGGSGATAKKTHKRSNSKHRTTSTQPTQTPAAGQTTPQQQSSTPPASTDPAALNDQGKTLIDSGRPAEAIPILERAVAGYPPDQRGSIPYGYALFNLADAYLRAGQPDKAIPLLQQRLKIPDQTSVVQAELQRAQEAAGQQPTGGEPGKGRKKGHHKKD